MQIIGITQVCAWPITVQYATACRCYASVVKVMTSEALRSCLLWLLSCVCITNPDIMCLFTHDCSVLQKVLGNVKWVIIQFVNSITEYVCKLFGFWGIHFKLWLLFIAHCHFSPFQIFRMEVPAIASHRSFIFMWVGNNEGLARGREVSLEYLISLLIV